MKKALLPVAALVLLTSCIPVEDFGAYWNKTGLDKRFAGSWKTVPSGWQTEEHGYTFGGILQFIEKNGAYELQDDGGKARGEPPGYPVKTLSVGRYQFLVLGLKKGLIERYKVNARTLELCDSIGPDLVDFVKKTYPNTTRVKANEEDMGTFMSIVLFNNEVFKILSSIPDRIEHPESVNGPLYWNCDSKFERVP